MEDQLSEDQLQKMLQFMATEHSVLQAGQSATIFETGGRTAVFLGTVWSTLIALAFIGQISGLGTAFFAFALVLLPTLFFLGLVTFERAMQLGVATRSGGGTRSSNGCRRSFLASRLPS